MTETPDEPRPPGEDPGDQQDRWPYRRSNPSTPPNPIGDVAPASASDPSTRPDLPAAPPTEPAAGPPHGSPTQQALGDLPPLDDDADDADGGESAGRRRWLSGGRLAVAGVAAVLLLGGGVALAGGGGDDGSDGDGVATVDGSDGDQANGDDQGGGDGGPVDESEMQDAMLEYAACMRDHGIDMPDPEFDGDGRGGGMVIQRGPDGGGGEGPGPDSEEFEAADEECGEIMDEVRGEGPQLSPEEVAELQDKLVAMAECMRDKGYDMPDPEVTGDGGVQIQMRGDGPDSGAAGVGDPRNDEFREDQEACNEEAGLENGPMGRRGGPAGGDEDGGTT